MECKNCKFFQFERTVYLYTNGPPLTLGICNYDNRGFGNKTLSINYCENFIKHGNLYHKGDVLKNQNEVLFISDITEDYYPRQYRVTNNRKTTFSISDDELSKYELVFSEGGAE